MHARMGGARAARGPPRIWQARNVTAMPHPSYASTWRGYDDAVAFRPTHPPDPVRFRAAFRALTAHNPAPLALIRCRTGRGEGLCGPCNLRVVGGCSSYEVASWVTGDWPLQRPASSPVMSVIHCTYGDTDAGGGGGGDVACELRSHASEGAFTGARFDVLVKQ